MDIEEKYSELTRKICGLIIIELDNGIPTERFWVKEKKPNHAIILKKFPKPFGVFSRRILEFSYTYTDNLTTKYRTCAGVNHNKLGEIINRETIDHFMN